LAITALTLNVPKKVTIGATYSGFSYTEGRNVLINAALPLYYHPTELDGEAVDATEQMQVDFSGGRSMRLPGSGTGKGTVGSNASTSINMFIGPTGDGTFYFSLARSDTSDQTVWIMIVGENVSR